MVGITAVFVADGDLEQSPGVQQGGFHVLGVAERFGEEAVGAAQEVHIIAGLHQRHTFFHPGQPLLSPFERAQPRAQLDEEKGVGFQHGTGQAQHPAPVGLDAVAVINEFASVVQQKVGGFRPEFIGQGLLDGLLVAAMLRVPVNQSTGHALSIFRPAAKKLAEQIVIPPGVGVDSRLHEEAAVHHLLPDVLYRGEGSGSELGPEELGHFRGTFQCHARQGEEEAHGRGEFLPQAVEHDRFQEFFQVDIDGGGDHVLGGQADQRGNGQGPPVGKGVPRGQGLLIVAQRFQPGLYLVQGESQVLLRDVQGRKGVEDTA